MLKKLKSKLMQHKRTAIANEILESTRESFNGNFFNSVIHKAVKIEEAQVQQKTVISAFPTSTTAKEYISLSNEILERLGK